MKAVEDDFQCSGFSLGVRCTSRSTNFFKIVEQGITYPFCEAHRPEPDWIYLVQVAEISEEEFVVQQVLLT